MVWCIHQTSDKKLKTLRSEGRTYLGEAVSWVMVESGRWERSTVRAISPTHLTCEVVLQVVQHQVIDEAHARREVFAVELVLAVVGEVTDDRDRQTVVAVGALVSVVGKAGDALWGPQRTHILVLVADRVEVYSLHAEGELEVTLHGRADDGHRAVVAVEAGNGEELGLPGHVADDDRVRRLDLDAALEHRDQERVVRVVVLEELGRNGEITDGVRVVVRRVRVVHDGFHDGGRRLREEDGVVTVLLDPDTVGVAPPATTPAPELDEILQTAGDVRHHAGGVLGAADQVQVGAGEVEQHEVVAQQGFGLVLVADDVSLRLAFAGQWYVAVD